MASHNSSDPSESCFVFRQQAADEFRHQLGDQFGQRVVGQLQHADNKSYTNASGI